jgi:hypothetical protein
MKKIIAVAILGSILFVYGATHEEPRFQSTDNIVVIAESQPIKLIKVYYDSRNSTMRPVEFKGMFEKVTSAWEDCGVVFELTNDPNASVRIDWKPELETGVEAYAEADYCGGNLERSSVTLSIGKFKKLTTHAKANTIAHELGHILCVDHSENNRSLMYDTMLGTNQKLLSSDVKQCIANLPNLYKEEN